MTNSFRHSVRRRIRINGRSPVSKGLERNIEDSWKSGVGGRNLEQPSPILILIAAEIAPLFPFF